MYRNSKHTFCVPQLFLPKIVTIII